MPEHKFKVGDRVVFTNDYGVCWGVKTITELCSRSYDLWGEKKTVPTYHYEGTDTPWCSIEERNFQLADDEDLAIHEAMISSCALFPETREDAMDAAQRYFQRKYGRPTTLEEREALLDTDPFEGEP